jgi:hypothetical protein
VPSSGWALTEHFLTGSTSAKPPLTRHRHSSVLTPLLTLGLRLHPSAAQAAQLHLTRAQSRFWALAIIGCLSLARACHRMNLINSTRCSARALLEGPPGPESMPSPRNEAFTLSVAHPFFRLWVHSVSCYIWFARLLDFDTRAADISLFVLSVPRLRPNSIFLPLSPYFPCVVVSAYPE